MAAEPETNGGDAFNLVAARTALMSSSTSLRMAELRAIDERIASKGAPACSF